MRRESGVEGSSAQNLKHPARQARRHSIRVSRRRRMARPAVLTLVAGRASGLVVEGDGFDTVRRCGSRGASDLLVIERRRRAVVGGRAPRCAEEALPCRRG